MALHGVIALDGPSGTGKSTVARTLARRLEAGYLDTGAMYRAATLAVSRSGVDAADPEAVVKAVRAARIELTTSPDKPVVVSLDGDDVSAAIRTDEVTAAVSGVAAVPAVREHLVAAQRALVEAAVAERGGVVVEGRDIGTVVCPDAGLKVFLTASPEVRAARRTAQNTAAGMRADAEKVREAVDRRDRLDSTRKADPMRPAGDAVDLDTSELDVEQVVVALLELVAQRSMLD